MKNRTRTVALMAALMLTSLPAFGQGRGNGQEKNKEHVKVKVRDQDYDKDKDKDTDKSKNKKHERARDRDDEVRVVHEYFVNTRSLPPGLAKRSALPPGLANQLRVNGTLPPGLAKRIRPVPVVLTRQLGLLPLTHRRVIIGNQLVVLDQRNNILDLFLLP